MGVESKMSDIGITKDGKKSLMLEWTKPEKDAEEEVTYPRTIEKDGYFCTSAKYDPFPNWPIERIYADGRKPKERLP